MRPCCEAAGGEGGMSAQRLRPEDSSTPTGNMSLVAFTIMVAGEAAQEQPKIVRGCRLRQVVQPCIVPSVCSASRRWCR